MTEIFRKDFSCAQAGVELHRSTCGRLLAEMGACCISGLARVSVFNYLISPQLFIPPVVCSDDCLAGLTVHTSSVGGCFRKIPDVKETFGGETREMKSQFMDMLKMFDSFHNRIEGTFFFFFGKVWVIV